MKTDFSEFTGVQPLTETTYLMDDLAARMDLVTASPKFDLALIGRDEACDIETDTGDVRLIRQDGSSLFQVVTSTVAELENGDTIGICGANIGGSLLEPATVGRFCNLAFSRFMKSYADDDFYQAVGLDSVQRSRNTVHLRTDDQGEFMIMWDLIFRATPPVQQVYRYADDAARRTPVF